MNTPYFDSARCENHFHYFMRTQRGIEPFHSNDQPCTESEYYLPLKDVPEVEVPVRQIDSLVA